MLELKELIYEIEIYRKDISIGRKDEWVGRVLRSRIVWFKEGFILKVRGCIREFLYNNGKFY